MSRGFQLIGGFLERRDRPATVTWLNSKGSRALPSSTVGIFAAVVNQRNGYLSVVKLHIKGELQDS